VTRTEPELTERMRERLAELRHELALGEEQLLALARQEAALRQQLLRIAGAAQVLVELLGETDGIDERAEPHGHGVSAQGRPAAVPQQVVVE
jgi:hypothetical protein